MLLAMVLMTMSDRALPMHMIPPVYRKEHADSEEVRHSVSAAKLGQAPWQSSSVVYDTCQRRVDCWVVWQDQDAKWLFPSTVWKLWREYSVSLELCRSVRHLEKRALRDFMSGPVCIVNRPLPGLPCFGHFSNYGYTLWSSLWGPSNIQSCNANLLE